MAKSKRGPQAGPHAGESTARAGARPAGDAPEPVLKTRAGRKRAESASRPTDQADGKARGAEARVAAPRTEGKTADKARGRPASRANGRAEASSPARPVGPEATSVVSEVRVRMYRHGLGDCFLLAFPKPEGGNFFLLIDCGIILGTPDPEAKLKQVVADIIAETRGHIDVLVVTHEHWDHVSAFLQCKELFDPATLAIDQVWLAWTEDPADPTAQLLRRQREQKLAGLWLGLGPMRARLAAAGPGADTRAAREDLERAAQVLSFFGIDPETESPPDEGGFGAAAAASLSKVGAAMTWARERTKSPKFCRPGDVFEVAQAGGVRVYVLGPPTDTKQLLKDMPTRSGRETYDEAPSLALAERAIFGSTAPAGDGSRFDPSLPFDVKYRITPEDARSMDFYQAHYFGWGAGDSEAWRRIDGDWSAGAAEFALQLDSDTNNTSLALAFELPDGRVLLFPGDAQVGNWESWHADSAGTPRVFQAGGRDVSAEQLLNRTVLYKVGHHGSHNATLRERGLEMMTDPDLTAMVPVDVYIAHVKKKWMKMPFDPLMTRLSALAHGRVVQADTALAGFAPGNARVTDAADLIDVLDEAGNPAKRPLYSDYALPLKK